jgi:glutathione peroxidase
MFKIIISALICLQTSIYSLQYADVDGNIVSMNTYQGKKILLVNIATGSTHVSQLGELQQLQQQYGDSVVVIAFPSNSFGNETRSNADIKQFCQSTYGTSFQIAAKDNVAGIGIQPIYNWLAHAADNGIMNGIVGGDFQKFLVNNQGMLVGVFAPSVSPMDSSVIEAINTAY